MFPRNLLLMLLLTCILYCRSYAEEFKEKAPLSDAIIVSTVMVCAMFSVLIVLVPTLLY